MWVKICGITRLEDALYAARFRADAVGFVFADSPRRITPDQARSITGRLPEKPARVGVFVDSPLEEVVEITDYCGLDLVQLHGDEDPSYCEKLGGSAVKAIPVNGSFDLGRAEEYACDTLLLDAKSGSARGGTGRSFDWKKARLLDGGRRVIVAGGLSPDNVAEAVGIARPYGVDVSSGVEVGPGIKDPVLMYRFIEEARLADYALRGH